MNHILSRTLPTLLAAAFSLPALATNGMNMEGYGPVATAMGGAGMAYDNGTAALMNNPATLALMQDGTRIDLAAGFLGPKVKANGQDSGGTAYVMPAFGIAHKKDEFVFGFGIFAQGGMGTEYNNASFYNRLMSTAGTGVTDPGLRNRSEIGVGRALIPLAWKANERLTIGGSIDYMWATMDMQMLIDGARFGDMMMGSKRFGTVTPNSALNTNLMAMTANMTTPINWGYFDFSDNNDFSGAAKASGWAGKIGLTYKITPELTAGLTYHSKSNLSDLTATSAKMSFNVGGVNMPAIQGKIKISNFQWPDQYGFGLSYTPSERWQLVADYRRIGWAAVMKQFKMTFESSMGNLDMTLRQDWKDQDVLMLGTAYKITPQITLRGGINLANNPVTHDVTNPLFPAIVKNHLTGGFGYAFDAKSSLDFAATYAPNVKVQSDFSGTQTSHGQINAQIMYSMFF